MERGILQPSDEDLILGTFSWKMRGALSQRADVKYFFVERYKQVWPIRVQHSLISMKVVRPGGIQMESHASIGGSRRGAAAKDSR